MSNIFRDIQTGFRLMFKRPAFTATVVLCLALGIGPSTALFSLLDGALMRPLRVRDSGRIVRVFTTSESRLDAMSYAEYLDVKASSQALEGVAIARRAAPLLTMGEMTLPAMVEIVSDNYLDVLGVNTRLGRNFSEADSARNSEPVAMMSYHLWQRKYNSDPAIIGKTVYLARRPFRVIGVASKGFGGTYVGMDAAFWIPIRCWDGPSVATGAPRDDREYDVVGRLREGVKMNQARAEAGTIAQGLSHSWPATNAHRGMTLYSLQEYTLRGGDGPKLALSGLLVILLLSIVCCNVACLLVARSEERREEIGLRKALGASRFRIIQQLLTESAVVGMFGAILGLALARLCIVGFPALMAILDPDSLGQPEFHFDIRVASFGIVVSILTIFLFGLSPALRISDFNLRAVIRNDWVQRVGKRRFRLTDVLVFVQIVFAFVAIVLASLLARSLQNAQHADLGFQNRDVLIIDAEIPFSKHTEVMPFYDTVLERLRQMPNVRYAAVASRPPLAGYGGGRSSSLSVPGYLPQGEIKPSAGYAVIGEDYFRAIGAPMMLGQDFKPQDNATSVPVAIINETMAQQFWHSQDVIGKTFTAEGAGNSARQVIGIVRNQRIDTITGEEPRPYFFIPFRQSDDSQMVILAETRSAPFSIAPTIRAEIHNFNRDINVYKMGSLGQLVQLRQQDLVTTATVAIALAILGLLVSVISVYGLTSYLTSMRRREYAIRMAIGAQPWFLVRAMLRRSMLVSAVALLVAIPLALLCGHLLSDLLFGVSAADPDCLAAGALLLIGVVVVGTYVPARRVFTINLASQLRQN